MPNLAATIRNADDARALTDGILDISKAVNEILDTIETEATAGNDKAVVYLKDKRSLRRLRRRFESIGFTVTEKENSSFVEFIVSW